MPHKAPFCLEAQALTQRFNQRTVWKGISLQLRNGEILGITGANGSGKTTLLRALCGLFSPSKGKILFTLDEKPLETEQIQLYCGFVAPYLTLYEEFTPSELVRIIAGMRSQILDEIYFHELLGKFGLSERSNEAIRGFSSGMKQRVKYILAFLFRPHIVMLDEPMTNLDASGIAAVEELITLHQTFGGASIIATNDTRDINLCTKTLAVTDFV